MRRCCQVKKRETENRGFGRRKLFLASSPFKTDREVDAASTVPSPPFSPVTLGHECVSDFECRSADPHSRCIDRVCECEYRGNGSSCAARKTGCAAGTFQCKSSGICISWFFVCDGRSDCEDGSDERCSISGKGSRCPEQAFRCAQSDVCVSRAVMCDGKRDCPRGEDEVGCNDRRSKSFRLIHPRSKLDSRESVTECPVGAFRCNNGQCLPAYEFCNAVVSCRDGSDEPRDACRRQGRGGRNAMAASRCPFRCDNGRCRSDAIACSGRDGCGDGSDERRCSVCSQYKGKNTYLFVSIRSAIRSTHHPSLRCFRMFAFPLNRSGNNFRIQR